MFPMYKAQRAPTPPAVTEGARQVRDLIRVMGIPEIIIPGVEADDAIGTLALRGIREGFQVAIASPDKVSGKGKEKERLQKEMRRLRVNLMRSQTYTILPS